MKTRLANCSRIPVTCALLTICTTCVAVEIVIPPKPLELAGLSDFQTAVACSAITRRAAKMVIPDASNTTFTAFATMATAKWSWTRIMRATPPAEAILPANIANQNTPQTQATLEYCVPAAMRYYAALSESTKAVSADEIAAVMKDLEREAADEKRSHNQKSGAFSAKVIERCGNPTLNQTQAVRVSQAAEQEFAQEISKWSWRTDSCGAYLAANYKGQAMSAKADDAVKRLNDSKASAPAFYDHCVVWKMYTLDVQDHCHE